MEKIILRKSQDRGFADHDWLKSYHTFSFADYYDPRWIHFRSLRVINEDRIAPRRGFGTHSHNNMEIISWVKRGSLQHQDSMGNKTLILPDEVQVMSAGLGVSHSELNAESFQESHFFQIWILPNQTGTSPSYGQKSFKEALAKQSKVLVASLTGRENSLQIKQDVELYVVRGTPSQPLTQTLAADRVAWLQVTTGTYKFQSESHALTLNAGDSLAIESVRSFQLIPGQKESEALLFDLA